MNRLGLLVVLLASSCATDRWHEYDESSQSVVMDPSEQHYAEHIQLLEAWAADASQPMPPGLYGELAYWLAKVGRYPEAEAAFQQELARHPQAEKFLLALKGLVIPPEPEESSPAEPTPMEPAPAAPAIVEVAP